MADQVAILHGWSDTSKSFEPLAGFLADNGRRTAPIFLGEYISLRDDVRIEDVAKRMEEVVQEGRKSGDLDSTFDMVVHSTGGLVVRTWISNHYRDRRCPVRNLVMLAPANFGSQLAHKGRSMLGRIYKGWRTGFETGEEMLHALELGSAFQWQLAQSDLFVPEGTDAASAPTFYGADRVRPYVIVGTVPYDSLAARITNEDGSDGTIRVAAASMNAYGMTVDFSAGPDALEQPEVRAWRKRSGDDTRFPIAVLPDRDHGTVVDPTVAGASAAPDVRDKLGELILEALSVDSAATYERARASFEAVTMRTRTLAGDSSVGELARRQVFGDKGVSQAFFHEYYQLVVRVEDEFGAAIPDYFVSFVPTPKKSLLKITSGLDKTSVFFHSEVLEGTHVHRRNPENRCFYIDRFDLMRAGGFYAQIPQNSARELSFTVTAQDPGDRIAYFSRRRRAARGVVRLHGREVGDRWLKRHSTHFVKVVVPRAADRSIFKLHTQD
ncbi:MAG: hypothetical protein E4H03_05010 [Myxococcales bacterium]|nr:MAG: hypothetical protein E4H03_05010 [Myxococcales bacterium]